MCVDRFHIVSLFLSNPCTPSTLSKEAFVYFVCPGPTEIPQPPFAWKYYSSTNMCGGVLHCVALCHGCSVSQCVAACCSLSVLQCGAAWVWCSVMQCSAVWCSVVQCGAAWCSAVQFLVTLPTNFELNQGRSRTHSSFAYWVATVSRID